MRLRYGVIAGLALLLFVSLEPSVRADRMKDRQKHSSGKKTNLQVRFGVRAGMFGAGTVTVEGYPNETKGSYSRSEERRVGKECRL